MWLYQLMTLSSYYDTFSIPKLQYLLRTAHCYKLKALVEYDNTLRSIMGEVTN